MWDGGSIWQYPLGPRSSMIGSITVRCEASLKKLMELRPLIGRGSQQCSSAGQYKAVPKGMAGVAVGAWGL